MKQSHLELNSYQEEYLKQILRLSPTLAYATWTHSKSVVVEGALGAGWLPDSRLLIFNYDAFEIVSLESESHEEYRMSAITDYVSEDNLFFRVKDGLIIHIFGIYGGNGNCITDDGWRLEVLSPAWPNSVVMLKNLRGFPNAKVWERGALLKHKVIDYSNLRCGFSPNEKALIIFNGDGAEVYTRAL